MEIGFSVERVLHTPVILPRNQFSYPSAVYYSIVTLLRLRPRAHTALTTKNDSFKNCPIADSTLRRTDRRHSRAGNMLHPALLCSTIHRVNYSLKRPGIGAWLGFRNNYIYFLISFFFFQNSTERRDSSLSLSSSEEESEWGGALFSAATPRMALRIQSRRATSTRHTWKRLPVNATRDG